MGSFPNSFFLGNIGQENVFYDILERKNVFVGHKNKKSRKIDSFLNFFFWQYRPAKCLLGYSRAKKRFSRLQKQEVQKVE